MRRMFPYRPALCAAVALAAAACTPSLNWREVRLAPTTAVALLPCKPDRAERSEPLGGELSGRGRADHAGR